MESDSTVLNVLQGRLRIGEILEYECGCVFGAEDSWDATCPIHDMPMKIGTIDYPDLEWAYRELSKRGTFGIEDDDGG